ncbi:MAG: phage integrase SAM-like domain-containing protein [Gluconobacter cerinus]
MGPTDSRRRLIEGMDYFLEDRAEQLEKAGKNPSGYVTRYREIALGRTTPIGPLFDRWMRDVESTIRQQTARGHRLAFRLFGEFLAFQDGDECPSQDPETLIASTSVESITKRRIGEFPEWLAQRKGLSAKTIQSRISPLKTFWDWLERKGYSETNPWLGATTGLKRRAEMEEKQDHEREYTETELIALLQANPDAHRRWGYGAAIFDLIRLGLLTGARQNELASLTRDRI